MSLATICQNVADEAGYTIDSLIVGSTENTTRQLRSMVNRVNQEMAEAYPWPILYASGVITLVAGQATYALPAAFSYYHYNTFWNQSTRWRVLGPMSPQEYAEIVGYGLQSTVNQRFQFRGISNSQLLIEPTPTESGATIIFEYIADRSVRPQTWVQGLIFPSDTNYVFYNGNYYVSTGGGTTGATPPTHTSGTVSDGGVSWTYYSGAYNEFLADTDVSLFRELTLEQGTLERFAEIHGLSVKPRFDVAVNEDYGRQKGGKIIYVGGQRGEMIYARNGVATFGTII